MMDQIFVTFDNNNLNKIFPYYILIDKSLKVKGYGKDLLSSCKALKLGQLFSSSWDIEGISKDTLSIVWFLENGDSKITISNKLNQDISLYGHFIYLNDSNNFLFIGSLETQKKSVKNDEDSLTKLKKDKERLSLFQSIIDNTKDAIHVVNENGEMQYINKEAGKRMHTKPEEIQNYTVFDFDTDFKEDKQNWYNHIKELKSNSHITMVGMNANPKIDPNAIPVEVTAKYIKIGEKAYIATVSRDISERKANEKRLKNQEERYRNLISNMNLGLLEVDNEGKIVFCNKSFETLSGYKLKEIKEKDAALLFGGETSKDLLIEKIEDRKQRKVDSYEIFTKNKKGENKWWLISGAPNTNDDGEIIGSIGIHLDITNKKKLEKELDKALINAQQASKAKETFLANMSHEMRTPLNGIIGMIESLNNEKLNKHQESYVDSALIASEHLLSVINNILDISKIEAEELDLNISNFSLDKLLFDVKKMLEVQVDKNLIQFEITKHNISNIIKSDKIRIKQIIINLLGNAIKFTRKGFIKLECIGQTPKDGKQKVSIKIEDSGIGIHKEYIDNVFNKFKQEKEDLNLKYSGTGLGLVITKELVELMGGTIQLSSTKNLGTEVKIEFNFLLGDDNIRATKLREVNYEEIKGTKILLVDDNELNRKVVKQAFSSLEVSLITAKNGKAAIKLLEKEKFNIVLMDIKMPIMGGIEATSFIRNTLKLDLPIIAISANAIKSEIKKCLDNGFDEYITKPFKRQTLLDTVYKYHKKENQNTNPDKLYNLDELEKISLGNKEFIKNMIDLFVRTIPESILELTICYENQKYDELKKIAHRIKPSIDSMGIITIKEDIRLLEQFDIENSDKEEMLILKENINATLLKVISQLKNIEI